MHVVKEGRAREEWGTENRHLFCFYGEVGSRLHIELRRIRKGTSRASDTLRRAFS
jgi:hypothetical protein